MQEKILVFGKTGWLCTKTINYLRMRGYEVKLGKSDITHPLALKREIKEEHPVVVINAAGKTGRPNIDWCELPVNRPVTYSSNALGPQFLLEACLGSNAHLVHYSSACIFDGYKPGGFTETDQPNPQSYYAETKVEGEQKLYGHDKVTILRPRFPTDGTCNQRNLITKLASYPRIISCDNSITLVSDFMLVLESLIKLKVSGVFNIVNPRPVTQHEILEWYKEIVDPNKTWEIISEDELYSSGLAKARRSNCVINIDKLTRTLGVSCVLQAADIGIMKCLFKYKQNLSEMKFKEGWF